MIRTPLDYTTKAFHLTALSLALALSGCGGGDGNTVDVIAPPQEGSGTGGPSNPGNPGNPGETVKNLLISDIVLYDVNGNPTRTVTSNGVKAKVTVVDKQGKGIPDALVTFSGTNVVFGSSNGSVVTNANGEAIISVKPANSEDTGSYSMSATVQYGGDTATSSNYFYSLQALDVKLADLVVADDTLETGGKTLITLTALDATTNQGVNNVTVNFSADCGSFDNAQAVSSNSGNVKVTYSSIDSNGQLCTGTQTITASTPNGSAGSLSTKVSIAAIEPTSINYTTQEGLTLGAKSSGSASTSQVEFTIYSNGSPASNQQVKIDLLRAPADFSFVRNGNRSSKILTSDASGKVSVTVYPGDIPGPVELKASLVNDPTIFALSKRLAVATGRPTQKGFGLSVGKQVLLNNTLQSTTITANLTDRQGNYVPEGTTVSFIAEGGTVTPSCSTNAVGQCSVTFTSQLPRPDNGRVSVLAYVEGDKDYIDIDGDNVYTAGKDKLSQNIGILYRDDNENMKYDRDLGEFQYSRNDEGSNACASPLFSQPSRAGTCNDKLDVILRRQVIMGFADATPTLINLKYKNGFINFDMYGNGQLVLPMPSGTTVTIEAEDRTENNDMDCKAEIASGYQEVPGAMDLKRVYVNNSGNLVNGFLNHPVVKYKVDPSGCTALDKIALVVTPPGAGKFSTRLEQLIPIPTAKK